LVLIPWRNSDRMENRADELRENVPPPEGEPAQPAGEPRLARWRRHGHRGLLWTWAALLVAMLVVIVALIVANTRKTKVSWVFGSTHTALIWIIVVSWIVGWVAGVATAVLLRRRTRRPV
jgi:uncharacterized integral membrane protein